MKRLKIINLALQNRVCSGDTLAACREYFKFINEFELGDVSNLSFPSYRKKILKDSLLYERISVLLICFIEGVVEKFSESKSYLLNLNTYSIDNLLLRLAIITKGSNK